MRAIATALGRAPSTVSRELRRNEGLKSYRASQADRAHGRIAILDDEKFVRGMVAKLTRHHESGEPVPWKMGDAPADYIADQLRHIVGIEIEIERIEGKRKLSQNRDERDFDGAVAELEARDQPGLANAMKHARKNA